MIVEARADATTLLVDRSECIINYLVDENIMINGIDEVSVGDVFGGLCWFVSVCLDVHFGQTFFRLTVVCAVSLLYC